MVFLGPGCLRVTRGVDERVAAAVRLSTTSKITAMPARCTDSIMVGSSGTCWPGFPDDEYALWGTDSDRATRPRAFRGPLASSERNRARWSAAQEHVVEGNRLQPTVTDDLHDLVVVSRNRRKVCMAYHDVLWQQPLVHEAGHLLVGNRAGVGE